MDLTTQKPSAQLIQQNFTSNKAEIAMLLTRLAIRKQAKLAVEDFQVFVEDLAGFELKDIAEGLNELGLTPRERGQTAFPESAVIVAAVKKIRNARFRYANQRREEGEWEAHKARCIEERRQEALKKSQIGGN